MLQTLNLSYTQWKQLRNIIPVRTFYIINSDESFSLILIDFSRNFIYESKISSFLDLHDFNSNIKPNAILQISSDACIASEIIN